MALIDCPECRARVSELAPTCPQCGAPIALAAEVRATGAAQITTTEQTAKRFKGAQLVGMVAFMTGAVGSCHATPGGPYGPILALIGGLGLVLFLVARAIAWWHHG